MQITSHCDFSDAERAALASSISSLAMLGDVVRWGVIATPPANIVDVVVQDEFTHDVIVSVAHAGSSSTRPDWAA